MQAHILRRDMKDMRVVLVVTVLISIGLIVFFVVQAVTQMKFEGLVFGLIIAPLLAYIILVSAGKIEEIGFGGIKAKFGKAATETVKPDFGEIGPSFEDLVAVGQKGIVALEEMLQTYNLGESKPIIVIIKLGRVDYKREETLGFINKLLQYRSFKFIVFSDSKDRLVTYMPSWAVKQTLSKRELGNEFISIINQDGRQNELLDFPHVIKDTLNIESGNGEALQMMEKLNLNALVVTDSEKLLRGVIEREEILSRMILTLIES